MAATSYGPPPTLQGLRLPTHGDASPFHSAPPAVQQPRCAGPAARPAGTIDAMSYPMRLQCAQSPLTATTKTGAPQGTTKQDNSRRGKRTAFGPAPRRDSKSRRSSKRRSSPSRSPTRRAGSKLQKDRSHGGNRRKPSGSPSAKSPPIAFVRKSEVPASPKSRKRRTNASPPGRNILQDSSGTARQRRGSAAPPWLLPTEITAPLVGPPLQPPQQPCAPATMYVPCHNQKCEAFPRFSEIPWAFNSVPTHRVPNYECKNFAPLPEQAGQLPLHIHESTMPHMNYAADPLPVPPLPYGPIYGYHVSGQRLEPGYSHVPSQGQAAYPPDSMPNGILRHYVSRANDGSPRWETTSLATTKEKASSSSASTTTSEMSSEAGRSKKPTENARLAVCLGCAGLLAFVTLYALLNVAVGGRLSANDGGHPMTVRAEDEGAMGALHSFDSNRQEAPHSQVLNAPSGGHIMTSRHPKVSAERKSSGNKRSRG
ncbi:arginine-glutamic acid dipeptide repeats protein-like [Dermacentor silvarum]|uniref:arginine-glutamic acid dipeptide repeats protein-like n=1 Tax=Dermacentor silvarum TaxID=543639 RepID=UPI0021012410|nr:arginine-glutamic acid dipeptide repeats protein-like [Dermacentor silvarum]